MSQQSSQMSRLKLFAGALLTVSLALPLTAQTSNTQPAQGTTSSTMNPADQGSYATGKPLATQSKEGFWGHVNPFARKKWVKRQLDPVKDRLNELDQLQAKNSNDIKDLDARTSAGIHQAQSTADQATQSASAANGTAGQAQTLAQRASGQTDKLNTTVSNLDQYQKVNDTELVFRPGQTMLNARAKEALDQVASQLQGQKGYIVEIEGYSRSRGQAGITSSQHMADAVVRYLVSAHQIPVYRIHQLALGNATPQDGTNAPKAGNVVRVSVMQNSLAENNPAAAAGQGSGQASQ